MNAVAHHGIASEGQCPEHRTTARKRDFQVLEHRQVIIDRGGWELAADARLHDLVFPQFRELLAAKLDGSRRRLGLSADQIEHRGLAGAVGADDDADFVLLDIEGKVVDGLEPVERNRERLDREQELLGLVTYQHDLPPHSAGAPSATELSVQPSPDFNLPDESMRSMRGCT